jgi:hypothetical protein
VSDHYFDAGAGAWRDEDEAGWLGERPEDDANEAPEWRDEERLPETDPDPDDAEKAERERIASERAHRELSGRVTSGGRRRGRHGTGFAGLGIRGPRLGTKGPRGHHTVTMDELGDVATPIRPTGRSLGSRTSGGGARDGDVERYLEKLRNDKTERRALRRFIAGQYGITWDDVRMVADLRGRPSKEVARLRERVARAFAEMLERG